MDDALVGRGFCGRELARNVFERNLPGITRLPPLASLLLVVLRFREGTEIRRSTLARDGDRGRRFEG